MKTEEFHKLLDQIIEYSVIMDEREKEKARRGNQGERTVGESWLVHHLKLLKEFSKEG